MATAVSGSSFLLVVTLPGAKGSRIIQSKRAAQPSRSLPVRALRLQSASRSHDVDNVTSKGGAEDATLKVFADETKGIVCYRTESGELVCEGMDEGPHFYPPSGVNFYMPDTRAAAILPLLGEVMYEI